MSVRYLPWITRDMLRAAPDERFVFGDNIARVGHGGQAGAMRGEPNAIGVATLYAPGEPYRPGCPVALEAVVADLRHVAAALHDDRIVYVPRDGIGTGIADLPRHAPDIHRLIAAFFRAASGHCPWEN
jgi:hypothetical protein